MIDLVEAWDICKTECSRDADRRQIFNHIAGVPELQGLRKNDQGQAVVKSGRKFLDDTALDQGRPSRRRPRSYKIEYAYEARLFKKYKARFDELNQQVREMVKSRLGHGHVHSLCRWDQDTVPGVTLGQFRKLARDVRARCESSDWLSWAALSMGDLVESILKPMTSSRCCSYAELVNTTQGPPPPKLYIGGESWGLPFASVAEIVEWCADARRLMDHSVLYLNCLSSNLHHNVSYDDATPEQRAEPVLAALSQCEVAVIVCTTERGCMLRAWRLWTLHRATSMGKTVDLGSTSGVLACTLPFKDGGWEFGHFDVSIARTFASTRCRLAVSKLEEDVRFMLDALAEVPSSSRADAYDRFDNCCRRLVAGPMLREAAARDDALAIREICRCPGLGLTSIMLKGGLGETALHVAASTGSLLAVCTLLELKADADAEDTMKETPLHYAAMAGCTPALRMLLSAKADPTRESAFRETPLHVAEQNPAAFLGVDTTEARQLLHSAELFTRMLHQPDVQVHEKVLLDVR